MITLFTGAPGAGKTNAMVSLLSEIGQDRAVYINGITDLKIPNCHELKDPFNWMNEVPDGSLVIIDEVQRYWKPLGPGQGKPACIEALETHRHRGLDFYIISQGPNLIHANVRALVGRHIHLRDLGIMGRWWYEWPEVADNCRTSWKNAPIKKSYKLDKKAQSLYTSASIHIKPLRSFPRMLVFMIIAVIVLSASVYYAFTKITSGKLGVVDLPVQNTSASDLPGAASAIQAQSLQKEDLSYNPLSFVPIYPDIPNSAPAYDHLRVVVNMPLIAGAIKMNGKIKCYSQQGTPLDISDKACHEFLDKSSFDPYSVFQPPSSIKSDSSEIPLGSEVQSTKPKN